MRLPGRVAHRFEFGYAPPMIVFWIAAALLSAFAAALMLWRAVAVARMPQTDPTVDVYRRQLGEIDNLADRGLLGQEERRSARTEAARRLLNAAQAADAAPAPPAPSRRVRIAVTAAAVIAPLLAIGLYVMFGAPGAPDQPYAQRLATWRNSDPHQLNAPQLAAVLQQVIKEHPKVLDARLFLARVQANVGDLPSAVDTLRSASRLAPTDASVWTNLGEVLVQQAQGAETADAVAAFRKALAIEPDDAAARYHLARAQVMSGDVAGGLAQWRALVASLPPGDGVQALQQQIDATAKAGRLVELTEQAAQAPAAAAPGPSQAQVDAAANAKPADQRAFIQSMVDKLAGELKANPKNPEGWARLIRAYGVLGEADRQAAAKAQAEQAFKGDAAGLDALRKALAQ